MAVEVKVAVYVGVADTVSVLVIVGVEIIVCVDVAVPWAVGPLVGVRTLPGVLVGVHAGLVSVGLAGVKIEVLVNTGIGVNAGWDGKMMAGILDGVGTSVWVASGVWVIAGSGVNSIVTATRGKLPGTGFFSSVRTADTRASISAASGSISSRTSLRMAKSTPVLNNGLSSLL